MKTIIKIILPFILLVPSLCMAALQPMDDLELSETNGQAMFEALGYDQTQPDSSQLHMMRLTIGARIELNANVEELSLGRYWRPEGTNCTGGAGGDKVCYNNIIPAGYNDNINWACTAKPCGSTGLDSSNYQSSGASHKLPAERSFFSFPGGFQPDGGVDVKLRDVTMGRIMNGVLEPLVQENPYLEFAFDESQGTKQLVGFRIGFEETHGFQGNIIDVMSGFIRPDIRVDAALPPLINSPGGAGTLRLEASLGGVRTIGWLDLKSLQFKGATGAAAALGVVKNAHDLLEQSPEAQLFPVQSNYLNHTKGMFFSMGIRPIQWGESGAEIDANGKAIPGTGYTPEVTSPGFWINMGGDGRLMAVTQNGDHPQNYFPGHPRYEVYKDNQPNYPAPNDFDNKNQLNQLPVWSNTY